MTLEQELYQQLIIDHNRSPKNFRKIENPTHHAKGLNPLCGDQYEIFLVVDDEGTITDASFDGKGCAISKASASIMTESLKGKPVKAALSLAEEFNSFLKKKGEQPSVRKLKVFSSIWKYPARVKCAALAWHAAKAALEEVKKVSTE